MSSYDVTEGAFDDVVEMGLLSCMEVEPTVRILKTRHGTYSISWLILLMADKTTLDFLLKNSKFTEAEKGDFLDALNVQLKVDNHDISLDEKLEMITTCFDKNVNSVVT